MICCNYFALLDSGYPVATGFRNDKKERIFLNNNTQNIELFHALCYVLHEV